jgi:hypothetical protein
LVPDVRNQCDKHVRYSFAVVRTLRALTLLIAIMLLAVGVASGQRAPTKKEHRQVAKAMKFPAHCTRVRVSTVVTSPKWASLSWKPGRGCKKFAADGVAILKKNPGAKWKFVTAGSSFDCGPLYAQVPQAVVTDLGISCI